MRVIKIFLLSGVLVVFSSGLSSSALGECCRDLDTEVLYDSPRVNGCDPYESEILRVDALDGKIAIAIRAPLHDTCEEATYISRDGGRSWDMTNLDEIPSPLLTGHIYQAPSNPNVVYKRLNDVGLYLRSEDGGQTWHLPQHSIEGKTRQAFALQQSGRKFYHVVFNIIAIHPRDPLTTYATIGVFHWGRLAMPGYMRSWEPPGPADWSPRKLREIYVSYDGAESWTKFTDAIKAPIAYGLPALGISPSNPDVMYGYSPCVKKSADGGQTLKLVGQDKRLCERPIFRHEKEKGLTHWGPPRSIEVSQFVIDPNNENIVYIVSNKGLYRSMDGGETWCLLDFGFDAIYSYYSLVLNPGNPEQLFAGTRYGVFRSDDRGDHWEKIYPSADSPP